MKRWLGTPGAGEKAGQVSAWAPLRIAARAMCCAVGHNAASASAAINARMNHFRETGFVATGGIPITGGPLFGIDAWGAERLHIMLRASIDEILASVPALETTKVALVILAAEPGRPGMDSSRVAQTFSDVIGELGSEGRVFHAASVFCAYGKGGVGRALVQAAQSMAGSDGPDCVLLAAADTLLDAGTIENFLDAERIATTSNADGFIPAEGAAAVLLSRMDGQPGSAALWIDAVASGDGPWRHDGDVPLRATALTAAIRSAAMAAGCEVAALDFHASGMTGEGWYSKEVSMALARCMERKKERFPHLMVARSAGETGAASPLLSLAWLAGMMAHPVHSPGTSALLHVAGDDGQRTAMVLRWRAAT